MNTGCLFDEPPLWRYFQNLKKKEVRKKMAIDYKEEWKKFRVYYGRRQVETRGVDESIGELMDGWIKATIESREKLMKEYLKHIMKTDITGGDKYCHYVGINFGKHVYGNIGVSKEDFHKWLKNRKEVK